MKQNIENKHISKSYILMHGQEKVANIMINRLNGNIIKIEKIYASEHLPIGTALKGTADRRALNEWWCDRSIPNTRDGAKSALEKLNVRNFIQIAAKSLGASMSDHYWIRPESSNITWDDVNFFDNGFSEKIGDVLFVGDKTQDMNYHSPDITTDGWLKKRWKIINGRVVLIKGGSTPFYQEPFNEVIASRLMDRLGIPHVDYKLMWIEGKPYSVCENFVTQNTELIPAYRVMVSKKQQNHVSKYQHFTDVCASFGMDIVPFLDKLLTIDYIIANQDRHFNNFGLIRNPETLAFKGAAPIFDSGTSMYYDQITPKAGKFKVLPFRTDTMKQLKLITSFKWLNVSELSGFSDELREIFAPLVQSGYMNMKRVDDIAFAMEKAVRRMRNMR